MKNIIKTLAIAMVAVAATACAKADTEPIHDDATISAIVMSPAAAGSSLSISGAIDNEAETIVFAVAKADRKKIDVSQVKLRANVGYDAFITPSLSGIKDLSEPLDITVTARQTGRTQKYTITAYYK